MVRDLVLNITFVGRVTAHLTIFEQNQNKGGQRLWRLSQIYKKVHLREMADILKSNNEL